MRINHLICAAIVATMVPAMALADDPRDPTMRHAAARARDSETTRQLNLEAGAIVRERDARNMQGWRTAGSGYAADSDTYAARAQDHDRAMTDYARDRSQYERDMAAWHRAVAACRDGDYAACD
jgi:hypothetical protein